MDPKKLILENIYILEEFWLVKYEEERNVNWLLLIIERDVWCGCKLPFGRAQWPSESLKEPRGTSQCLSYLSLSLLGVFFSTSLLILKN